MKHTKIPDDEVRNMHRLRIKGWTQRALCHEFGVSIGQVERILNGSSRRDIWLEFYDPVRLAQERAIAAGPDVPQDVKEQLDEIFAQFIPKEPSN